MTKTMILALTVGLLPEDERFAKTTWKHWSKKAKPLVSGLLGPVSLVERK